MTAENDAYALVCKIGRMGHPADDEYAYPDEDDTERETLNGLIAEARDLMSAPSTARDLTPSAAVGGEGADIDGAEITRARFVLEDCAAYLDTLYSAHKIKPTEQAIDTSKVRAVAAALQPSSAADAKPVAWRYRYPTDEAWQLTQDHDQAFKNTGEVEPLAVIPFAQPHPSQQAGTEDCFECCAPLVGPFCPECNPTIKQALGFPVEAANGSGWPSREEIEEEVTAAFEAGAWSVHDHWTDNPGEAPKGDPEFAEAAMDYTASLNLFPDLAASPPLAEGQDHE